MNCCRHHNCSFLPSFPDPSLHSDQQPSSRIWQLIHHWEDHPAHLLPAGTPSKTTRHLSHVTENLPFIGSCCHSSFFLNLSLPTIVLLLLRSMLSFFSSIQLCSPHSAGPLTTCFHVPRPYPLTRRSLSICKMLPQKQLIISTVRTQRNPIQACVSVIQATKWSFGENIKKIFPEKLLWWNT